MDFERWWSKQSTESTVHNVGWTTYQALRKRKVQLWSSFALILIPQQGFRFIRYQPALFISFLSLSSFSPSSSLWNHLSSSRYEGFAIDLAAALAEKLHFNFTFKIVDDGKVPIRIQRQQNGRCWWWKWNVVQYGGELSPGNWNGMLSKVQTQREAPQAFRSSFQIQFLSFMFSVWRWIVAGQLERDARRGSEGGSRLLHCRHLHHLIQVHF